MSWTISCMYPGCSDIPRRNIDLCTNHSCPVCFKSKPPGHEFCRDSYCRQAQCWHTNFSSDRCKNNFHVPNDRIPLNHNPYGLCELHGCHVCKPTNSIHICSKLEHHCAMCDVNSSECGHVCDFPGCNLASKSPFFKRWYSVDMFMRRTACDSHRCKKCFVNPRVVVDKRLDEYCRKCLKFCEIEKCWNFHAQGTARCSIFHACVCFGGPKHRQYCNHRESTQSKEYWKCRSDYCTVCVMDRYDIQWLTKYLFVGLGCGTPIIEAICVINTLKCK